jgi:hypothetical protein
MVGFTFYQLSNVWNYKTTMSNSTNMRNMGVDLTPLNLTAENFDLALTANYYGVNPNITNVYQYVTPGFYYIIS